MTRAWAGTARGGLVVAATVFSHFLLDALVHVVGLPVAGPGSYRLGLGLWRHMGLELAVELTIAGCGLWVYLASATASRARQWGLGALVALCALLTVMGGLATEPPPSAGAMATVSLVVIAVLSALAFWLDRGRGAPPS